MGLKKKNKEAVIPEVEAQTGLGFKPDSENVINSDALNNKTEDADELSLSQAMTQSRFKLSLLRFSIKLKNHIAYIPLVMTVLCMMMITFNISIHVQALVILKNDPNNALKFFINVVLSIVMILIYINVQAKHQTPKKKWIFFGLYFVVVALVLLLDFEYAHDIGIETSLFSSVNQVTDGEKHYVSDSLKFTNIHAIMVIITAILAAVEPVLQPLCKKIHFGNKVKKD
jgi:hypothetical protein